MVSACKYFALLYTLLLIPSLCPAQEGELVFVLKGRGNVFWQVINQGIRETAETLKLKAVIYNTDDDQSSEAQLNICLTALARKPKVVVMGAATKTIGIECYKKAAAAGAALKWCTRTWRLLRSRT